MARVPDSPDDALSPEQRRIHEEIAGPRGGVVRGPFALWLRNPAIAERANQFGNTLRVEGKLDKRLFELTILAVARHWSARYEFFAHAKHAIDVGVAPEIVEAIRTRANPAFAREDEKLIYDLITELNQSHTLSQASYERGIGALGLDLMIEFVTVAGFYTMVAMMINAFDALVPGGERVFE